MLYRKMRRLLAGFCTLLSFSFHAGAQPSPDHPGSGTWQRISSGIIVYPDSRFSGNTASVVLEVVANNIIRVLATPIQLASSGTSVVSPSLIRIDTQNVSLRWEVKDDRSSVTLSTGSLAAHVSLLTGAVRFTDPAGKTILAEKETDGRHFGAAVADGKASFRIRQSFRTLPGEAFYGLGQHQDDLFNYKDRQVYLFQNNTEVAVPFMVSNKNYGILWDNASLTTVGDIRPWQPLSSIGLLSATGERGWLTASYRNDRDHPGTTDFTKAESVIDYPFLGDTKKGLPAAFKPGKGSVTWEGSLFSGISGSHVFRFTYGGYCKVWIDGKLLLDRWRQAWNPGSAILPVEMEKDKNYPVKIEWMPDGDESYISLKWMPPVLATEKDVFGWLSEAGQKLDYYFIAGAGMDEVIAGYRRITGKSTIAPKWAMGLWQSRERYKTEEEILSTVKEFRRRKIPLDNIVLDWSYWKQNDWGSQEFDAARFPSPDSMIRTLHNDHHTHFMISVWPKFYEGISSYRLFDQNNWLYRRNVADSQRDWIAQGYVSTFYDAFNPAARKGFWDLLNQKLYNKGIDAWWMDASEPDILSNVSPEKRLLQMSPTALGPAAEILNAYPLENAKGIYEGQRAANPDQRVFILTRSAFAGSQHYGAAIWSGDIAARWADMHTQIAAGINLSMSGIPYWTMDIGGFAVEHRFEQAKGEDLEEWREQMTRWYQFGAFCPLFRVHGQFPYREIYNVAPEDHPAYRSMLYYDRLRYRLLPYIYSLAGMTWLNDYTIMRGLVMDFPADTAVRNIGDEYMFGPSLLVAPVTKFHDRTRNLYLPAGGWYDLYSGKYQQGGQSLQADAPYERMPVFVREGSIIPSGPDLQYSSEKPADPITIRVYAGRDAAFSLYEDENTNYNYEKGKFTSIPFRYEEATATLTIGPREGGFPGMLKDRTFRIIRISRTHEASLDGNDGPAITVHYNGKQKTVSVK